MRDGGDDDGGDDGDEFGQTPDWQQRVTEVQHREAFSCPKFTTKNASGMGDASKSASRQEREMPQPAGISRQA
jgi:hypothetical protein